MLNSLSRSQALAILHYSTQRCDGVLMNSGTNKTTGTFVFLFWYKVPVVDVIMVLRPKMITYGIAPELIVCSRCCPFNKECFWFCTFWKIGISGICKGHCFYQMKVTADKSKCLSASVAKQTKETSFFSMLYLSGFSPSLGWESGSLTFYKLNLTQLYAKCINSYWQSTLFNMLGI